MDTSSNWRSPQAEPAVAVDTGDWRSQLHPDSRQRIVNKIMATLKRHLPLSGQGGLQEHRKIAMKFEEKIYNGATSQSDYLRKIALKMLTMESKSKITLPPNAMASNSTSKSPQDPGNEMNIHSFFLLFNTVYW
ncbi:Mediator of RNA polymerase II transcription subunit 15a [Dionaea muscipula]